MKESDLTIEENWAKLEKTLGYSFQDQSLLVEAMTHSSYANEHDGECADNERLEFLGDAVLDLVVSQHLMSTHPESHEGILTRIRADVVAMPSLAELAGSLEIGCCLLLGKGEERSGGRSKSNLLADALEALFGAIFLDGGFESARAAIAPLFASLIANAAADEGQDYKSRLQEVLQAAQRALPNYELVDTSGPAHDRHYHVNILIDGQFHGAGEGRTKKSAEQAAAKAALKRLSKDS